MFHFTKIVLVFLNTFCVALYEYAQLEANCYVLNSGLLFQHWDLICYRPCFLFCGVVIHGLLSSVKQKSVWFDNKRTAGEAEGCVVTADLLPRHTERENSLCPAIGFTWTLSDYPLRDVGFLLCNTLNLWETVNGPAAQWRWRCQISWLIKTAH